MESNATDYAVRQEFAASARAGSVSPSTPLAQSASGGAIRESDKELARWAKWFMVEFSWSKDDVILEPRSDDRIGASTEQVERQTRLGGLLNFYCRKAGIDHTASDDAREGRVVALSNALSLT